MGFIIKNFNRIIQPFGYVLRKKGYVQLTKEGTCNINVGSGNWSAKGWINLDYPSDWYKEAQKKHTIVPYDIRNENLPFENESVDLIYISHVIEHIENKYILNLFQEMYRVLRPGGGARICCPDAEFLYNITKFSFDNYWEWRKEWFASSFYHGNEPRPVDFLVREIATPKLLGYKDSINEEDYLSAFNNMSMSDFFEFLTCDLKFRETCVGDHINYWTYTKVAKYLSDVGFKKIVQSKWSASNFPEMKDIDYFDIVYPNMSLYIDVVK